ncbi:hypothetical protein I552_3954 [Mycobacterium xenopi 3993]|nr:hypothetical protein I552_3954 [Mycobacterium xenopi 3993]
MLSASSRGWRAVGSDARHAGMGAGRLGYARVRRVEGLGGPLRPRRARCRACLVTHVLLPVTVLLRRAYAAERIWAALTSRAEGAGHRRIGASLGVPAATVRAGYDGRLIGSR